MSGSIGNINRNRGIAFLGNYLPRACGIATFTHDLAEAVARQSSDNQEVIVAAMNDLVKGYAYPDRVKFELRQDHQVDYTRAADFLNFSNIDVVSLQHEYGIYGGDHGSNVLSFLRNLSTPVVVTCHTVLEKPLPIEKEILREISANSEKLVVMSSRAYDFLENAYGISRDKIALIPHGIHDAPFIDPNYYKDKFGVEGRKVLLTFGLLNRNKGIEYVIEALPKIIEKHPKTTYVILGATHPAVVRLEGESYRLSLQRRIRELGLEDHVLFYPRFVELDELLEYLGATDIFVTPYLKLEQITSGALAYAMGTGKAVVSTPYWHAEELLADGRGILVPPADADALAEGVNSLLGDEIKLNAMRKRAFVHCQEMVWSNVARLYMDLFDEVRSKKTVPKPVASALRSALEATNIPAAKLDHVKRLTDDTGPCRHARYTIPDWSYGYSLDMTAATLVAVCKYHDIYGTDDAERLTEICLGLIETLIGENDYNGVARGLDYNRTIQGRAGEEAVGMAIWALGYVVWRGAAHLKPLASELLHQILPQKIIESSRGASYAILGAANYLRSFPGAAAFKRFIVNQLQTVESQVAHENWPQLWGTADWPVAVQAICVAAKQLENAELGEKSLSLLQQMGDRTEKGTVFLRCGKNSTSEELPVTAATFMEAMGAAYFVGRDPNMLAQIRSAMDWFLGDNRNCAELYDFTTGGCHDAISSTGVNRNQGTEATVYCMLAFLSLNLIVTLGESTVPTTKE